MGAGRVAAPGPRWERSKTVTRPGPRPFGAATLRSHALSLVHRPRAVNPVPDREGLTPPWPLWVEDGRSLPAWPGLELTPAGEVEGYDARRDAMLRLYARLQRGAGRVLEFRRRGPAA